MSIKVYRAYRFRKGQFWKTLQGVHKVGKLQVQEHLRDLYVAMMDGVKTDTPRYQKALEGWGSEGMARLNIVHDTVLRGYRMATTSARKSLFNLDVSIAFREHQGYIYMIPYCEGLMQKTLDFLEEDARLEPFWYNGVIDHRLAEVPEEVWSLRAKTWQALSQHWHEMVVHDICTWDLFPYVSPYLGDTQFMEHVRNWGRSPLKAKRVSDLILASKISSSVPEAQPR